MKKLFVLAFLLFIVTQNLCLADNDPFSDIKQSKANTNLNVTENTTELSLIGQGATRLSILNLQFELLGVVLFGPMIALDVQFANLVSVGPYFRWNYAGVIYQGIVTDWFSDGSTASPASYGIGVQTKFLIPVGSGKNRPYVGFGYERFNGSDSYDSGGTLGNHIWEYKANVYHFDLGYRLITDKSFNFSAGLSLGVSIDTDNIDYYENDPDNINQNELTTRFLPMIQIVMGWQIGPH